MQGAKIDTWGIGTKLITAYDQPTLGAVYKLVAIEDEDGQLVDTIKISNNVGKMSTPGKNKYGGLTIVETARVKGIILH